MLPYFTVALILSFANFKRFSSNNYLTPSHLSNKIWRDANKLHNSVKSAHTAEHQVDVEDFIHFLFSAFHSDRKRSINK